MKPIDFIKSTHHRVALVVAATGLVMAALLVSNSHFFRTAETVVVSRAGVKQFATDAAAIKQTSFVVSPTTEANPKFFFGARDGSNGYYAERPRQ
jgi:hypothetical protein